MLISPPSASCSLWKLASALLESGGGVVDLCAFWFGGLDDLIERFDLFVEFGIRFGQLRSDLLQAGFLSVRKRAEKILVASANLLDGLVEGCSSIGQSMIGQGMIREGY